MGPKKRPERTDRMDKREEAEKALADMTWNAFTKAMDSLKAADERAAREAERIYRKGKTLLIVRRDGK